MFLFEIVQFYIYTLLIVLIFKIGHIVDRCLRLAVKAKYIDTLIKLLLLL